MGIYKNPLTATQIAAPESVGPNRFFGTNFSILGIGGHVEVFKISDLNFIIDTINGPVENPDNKIPIRLNINPSPGYNVLTLNSDNISSGRRRLGMRAYVYENETVYEYNIPNYESLFSLASATTAVTITEFGTTVDTSTPEGINLINAWTASTIHGVTPGYDYSNANWRIVSSNSGSSVDIYVTGGTYSDGTAIFRNNQGGVFNVSGFTSGGASGSSIIVTGQTGDGSMRRDKSNCSINESTVFGCTNTALGFHSGVLSGLNNILTGNCATISGGYSNCVLSKVYGTIGGGNANVINYDGTNNGSEIIGGGRCNLIQGYFSSILGGYNNNLTGASSSIGGGSNNKINACSSSILGGNSNEVQVKESLIVGGSYNKINLATNSCGSALVGGCCNSIVGNVSYSFLGGGLRNIITNSYSVIVGGYSNLNNETYSSVLGGAYNSNTGTYSSINGGCCNSNSGASSSILGGYKNSNIGANSSISGGYCNSNSGASSSILGGCNNLNIGANSSISGGQCNSNTGSYSSISGGYCNSNSGVCSSILGGYKNSNIGAYSSISGGYCNSNSGDCSSILGGRNNLNQSNRSTIIQGTDNLISSDYSYMLSKIIVGGSCNKLLSGSSASIILNGYNNLISNFSGGYGYTTIEYNRTGLIGGGEFNTLCGDGGYGAGNAFILLGKYNTIYNGGESGILSGIINNISGASFSIINAGCNNLISGSTYSSINNGTLNTISGSTHSVILGGSGNLNTHSCSFIVGNSITTDRACTTFVNNLSIKNIPLSSVGLPSGSVWSDSGTLKIVT